MQNSMRFKKDFRREDPSGLERSPRDLNHFVFLGFPSGWECASLRRALIWEAQNVARLFLRSA
jgi:hypothetical protein